MPIVIFVISTSGLVLCIKYNKISLSTFDVNNFIYYLFFSVIFYFLSSTVTPIILGIKDYIISFWIQTAAYASGSPTPIKIGLPIKIYLFKKYLNTSVIKTTTAIIFESLIRIIILFILVPLSGGLKYLINIKQNYFFIIPIIVIIIIVMVFFQYSSGNLIEKIKTNIFVFKTEFKRITKNLNITIRIIFIHIILQLIYTMRILVLINSIGIESLTFLQVARAVIATSLLTTISLIPGGYGIREVSIIYLLQLEGIDYANSIFISLADRSIQLMIAMFLGIFASIYFTKKD